MSRLLTDVWDELVKEQATVEAYGLSEYARGRAAGMRHTLQQLKPLLFPPDDVVMRKVEPVATLGVQAGTEDTHPAILGPATPFTDNMRATYGPMWYTDVSHTVAEQHGFFWSDQNRCWKKRPAIIDNQYGSPGAA